VVDDSSSLLDPFTGGCLRVVAVNLLVEDCYFYSIRSDFYGSAISATLTSPPVLSRLTLRSISVLPETTGSDVLDIQPYGAMISIRSPLCNTGGGYQEGDAPVLFNASVLYDNTNIQVGNALGGVAIWTPWEITIRALNLTRVNSPLSNGLLFQTCVPSLSLSVAFCEFSNCTNEAYGIIVLYFSSNTPVIDFCNFVNQTVNWGLIPWLGATGTGEETRLTLSNSVILVSGPLICVIAPSSSKPLQLILQNCVFSFPTEQLSSDHVQEGESPAGVTVVNKGMVTFDVGINATFRMPIDDELAKYVRPSLTVTLAFTASSEFPPLSIHDATSIFAMSTSLSAGVLATIFGILSLIVFLFLLYLRRGSAQKFKLIGRFNPDLEFDGAGRAVAYDADAADVEYTYSVSYEYYYDSEGKPAEE
jgi:hypothetical protein